MPPAPASRAAAAGRRRTAGAPPGAPAARSGPGEGGWLLRPRGGPGRRVRILDGGGFPCVRESPGMNLGLPPNHFERIKRAAGAAADAPHPPRSIVTATTIGRLRLGTKQTYQDWSSWPGRSAVPVLPKTGNRSCGQPEKTSAEVPPGALAGG